MPYRWTEDTDRAACTLWPHQSLTGPGFATFFGATAIMLALPLLSVLGSPILWVLLVFFVAAFVGVWYAVQRNRTDRRISEELVIARDHVALEHRSSGGTPLRWHANPSWVRVHLRSDGPVEHYLTLTGGGREVELGRFLTPEERIDLRDDLDRALAARKASRV